MNTWPFFIALGRFLREIIYWVVSAAFWITAAILLCVGWIYFPFWLIHSREWTPGIVYIWIAIYPFFVVGVFRFLYIYQDVKNDLQKLDDAALSMYINSTSIPRDQNPDNSEGAKRTDDT